MHIDHPLPPAVTLSNGGIFFIFLRIYAFVTFNAPSHLTTGYFQGMNDLLALILYVIQSEEESFWCFVGLMERLVSSWSLCSAVNRLQFNLV